MNEPTRLDRRSVLLAAGGGAAGLAAAGATAAPAIAGPKDWDDDPQPTPLWRKADRKGIVFGSSIATWQLEKDYARLHAREAGLLFTEDDLLWYQLKPGPGKPLNFGPGDKIVRFAERNKQLVLGAHLVWDEGFGEGWSEDDLWNLNRQQARRLLYGVIRKEVTHYRNRVDGWIVANEVSSPENSDRHGFRKDVPWYRPLGPGYVAESFHIAKARDPKALRIINEFGFETVNEWGDRPEARRRAYLKVIDRLLDQGAPVQAVGIQGHLLADRFHQRFHERQYQAFLREIADRGLPILITELDVLDDGLPKAFGPRDQKVGDVYRHFLDVALDVKAVKAVITFGLTDRFSWLDEDQPREDGTHRRPLPFARNLKRKPAYWGISKAFAHAPRRRRLWDVKDVKRGRG